MRQRLQLLAQQYSPPIAHSPERRRTANTVQNTASSAGIEGLPEGMHLLSLYVRQPAAATAGPAEVVIQLQNIVEHGPPLVLVGGIGRLLGAAAPITTCVETTLTLQQPLASNQRLQWLATDRTRGGVAPSPSIDCATQSLSVDALDIRTFVVQLKRGRSHSDPQ